MEQPFDIAPFAQRCCLIEKHQTQTTFDYRYGRSAPLSFEKSVDHFVLGLQWAEERDIENVRMRFSTPLDGGNISLHYWFRNWPCPPPRMPTIEDPVDDPWQGRWITAASKVTCTGAECIISFLPLTTEENPRTINLPGLSYRHTLKIRLVSDRQQPLEAIRVFSRSVQKATRIRLELGAGTAERHIWEGKLTAYNGSVSRIEAWRTSPGDRISGASFHLRTGPESKGMILEIQGADARPPGSHDVTIVTVWSGDRTFSFAVPDVEKGVVYVPAFHAYATLASNPEPFSPAIVKAGERIRERLAAEPEQTYERAAREIPPLNPVERQGGRLYLPLASDSSWQKFAFEWGGNITIDKRGTKAKGAELRRLEWSDNRISWRIGTGAKPTFRPRSADSRLSVLEDHLPLPTAAWSTDQIAYSEEAFVTQLSGPLGVQGRDEQTPSVLNDFVSCYYPDVNVFTEEYRQWRSPSGPFYKVPDEARFVNRVRDLLVLENGQELWLTAGTPRRWLAPGQSITLDRMPTNFGPVSLELLSREGKIIGRIQLPLRVKFGAAWLVLRIPEGKRIGSVEINGKSWPDVDTVTGRIRLPIAAEPLHLRATIIP